MELPTLHRAKGLEWDAVLLPGLEEGTLPIRQALADPEALAEERRLLYVGLTRARRALWLGWAHQRAGATGRETARQRSRFLAPLVPPTPAWRTPASHPGAPPVARAARPASPAAALRAAVPPSGTPVLSEADERLTVALRAWRRERALHDGVPAYVVFPDATLAALVSARPLDTAALAAVHGFGPSRLQHYGSAIVELIRSVR